MALVPTSVDKPHAAAPMFLDKGWRHGKPEALEHVSELEQQIRAIRSLPGNAPGDSGIWDRFPFFFQGCHADVF